MQKQIEMRFKKMYSFYNIWNYDYVQEQARQQHHNNQIRQAIDAANKLKDFLDSMDKVDKEYKNMATAECCAVLVQYAKSHDIIK